MKPRRGGEITSDCLRDPHLLPATLGLCEKGQRGVILGKRKDMLKRGNQTSGFLRRSSMAGRKRKMKGCLKNRQATRQQGGATKAKKRARGDRDDRLMRRQRRRKAKKRCAVEREGEIEEDLAALLLAFRPLLGSERAQNKRCNRRESSEMGNQERAYVQAAGVWRGNTSNSNTGCRMLYSTPEMRKQEDAGRRKSENKDKEGA